MSFREALLALAGMLLLLLTCVDVTPARSKTSRAVKPSVAASVGLSSVISIPRK